MPAKKQIATMGLKQAQKTGFLGGAAESLTEFATSMPVMGGLLSGL